MKDAITTNAKYDRKETGRHSFLHWITIFASALFCCVVSQIFCYFVADDLYVDFFRSSSAVSIATRIILALLLYILVSAIQLFTGTGVFDINDILLNGAGILAGLLIYRIYKKRKGIHHDPERKRAIVKHESA